MTNLSTTFHVLGWAQRARRSPWLLDGLAQRPQVRTVRLAPGETGLWSPSLPARLALRFLQTVRHPQSIRVKILHRSRACWPADQGDAARAPRHADSRRRL